MNAKIKLEENIRLLLEDEVELNKIHLRILQYLISS